MTNKNGTENGTVPRGNSKSRGFVLTIYNEEAKKSFLKMEDSCRYMIYGEEKCPTTGRPHWQAYIYFDNPRSHKALCKKIPKTHIETQSKFATWKENVKYCSKDGKWKEFGDKPKCSGSITADELRVMNDEECIEANPRCWRSYRDAKDILVAKATHKKMLDDLVAKSNVPPAIVYLTGGTGKGKTINAYLKAVEKFGSDNIGTIDFANGFANGVNLDAKCLVVPEFRSSDLKADKFLQFTDKYGCCLNVKGGQKYIKPEAIFICSIIDPKELYKNEEITDQFLRRITDIIRFV